MRVLVKGEHVRLIPGGTLHEVVRVSACAAYLQAIYDPPVVRVFTDPHTGKERRVRVSRGPVGAGISPCAFVYRDAANPLVLGETRPELEAPPPGSVCGVCGAVAEVVGFCGVCEESHVRERTPDIG